MILRRVLFLFNFAVLFCGISEGSFSWGGSTGGRSVGSLDFQGSLLAFAPGSRENPASGPPESTQLVDSGKMQGWEISGIQVGFGGVWRAGNWTPVTLFIRLPRLVPESLMAQTIRLEIGTPDGDGDQLVWYSDVLVKSCLAKPVGEGVLLSPTLVGRYKGDLLELKTCVRIGSPRGRIVVRLSDSGGLLTEKTFEAEKTRGFPRAVGDAQAIYVMVGEESAGLKEALAEQEASPRQRPVVATLSGIEHLPGCWLGYEAAAGVIVSFGSRETVEKIHQLAEELRALRGWVASGGRLVVGFDPAALQLARAQDWDLVGWCVPGQVEKPVPFSRARCAAIELFAGARNPLGAGGLIGLAGQTLVFLKEPRGNVEAAEGQLPLVIRHPVGLGQVLWCAFPLDHPLIANWRDRRLLFARLLELPVGTGMGGEVIPATAHFGYEDLAGQLRSSLDRFPGVTLLPFGLVAGLMLLHILLIGPADYFLMRRFPRHRWVAWASLAIAVVAFGGLAYWMVGWTKGTDIQVRQVHLIDIASGEGTVCLTTWATVYSPLCRQVDLAARPSLPGGSSWSGEISGALAWWGLPGEGFGGMSSLRADILGEKHQYFASPEWNSLANVFFLPAGTKAFLARWMGRAETTLVTHELTIQGGELAGWIRNQVPVELEDCQLVFGRYVYQLGSLPSGGAVFVGRQTPRRDLRGFLTGTQLVREKETYLTQTTPYDPASRDPAYILRMMMFHESAGGTGYTGLLHIHQGFLDFSSLLRTQQAILICRAEGPAQAAGGIELSLSAQKAVLRGQVENQVIYRFVLPCSSAPRTASTTPLLGQVSPSVR